MSTEQLVNKELKEDELSVEEIWKRVNLALMAAKQIIYHFGIGIEKGHQLYPYLEQRKVKRVHDYFTTIAQSSMQMIKGIEQGDLNEDNIETFLKGNNK